MMMNIKFVVVVVIVVVNIIVTGFAIYRAWGDRSRGREREGEREREREREKVGWNLQEIKAAITGSVVTTSSEDRSLRFCGRKNAIASIETAETCKN